MPSVFTWFAFWLHIASISVNAWLFTVDHQASSLVIIPVNAGAALWVLMLDPAARKR